MLMGRRSSTSDRLRMRTMANWPGRTLDTCRGASKLKRKWPPVRERFSMTDTVSSYIGTMLAQVFLNPSPDVGNRTAGKFVGGMVKAEVERGGTLPQLPAELQVFLPRIPFILPRSDVQHVRGRRPILGILHPIA